MSWVRNLMWKTALAEFFYMQRNLHMMQKESAYKTQKSKLQKKLQCLGTSVQSIRNKQTDTPSLMSEKLVEEYVIAPAGHAHPSTHLEFRHI